MPQPLSPAQQQQQQLQAQIAQNRTAANAIRNFAVRRTQSLNPSSFNPTQNPTLNVKPSPVGLILGFWVKVVTTVSNGSAVVINKTDFGPAASLSQIQLLDLSNQTRIQTPGYHIHFLNSWKIRKIFGNALIGASETNTGNQTSSLSYVGQDSPTNFGSNWTINSCPATIAAISSGTPGTGIVTQWYYVPLAYNPDKVFGTPDFRGSIYAGTTAANIQLNLSHAVAGNFRGGLCAANGADSTNFMFVGATSGSVAAVTATNCTITVYQDYYDQLPDGSQFTGVPGVLLPLQDTSTIYDLKCSPLSGMVAGTEFGYQYANFRSFLSTLAVYVENGTTGARNTGSDINYWALQAANNSDVWLKEPALVALETRNHINLDFPAGVYMFDSRQSPINTQQFGVMQLILNASAADATAYEMICIEDFQILNAQGQSLPSA